MFNRRRSSRRSLLALMGTGLLVAAGMGTALTPGAASAEEIVAKLAFHWNLKHTSGKHAQIFADTVNERAKGKLRIDVYPTGQLFGIREILGGVTSGAVQLGGIVGVVSFPPINKDFNIANFPGLFRDYQQQRDFFTETEAGRGIWEKIQKKSNTVRIMFDPVGPILTMSSKRALTGVKAMEGLKARVIFQIERPLWKELKVSGVSLPTREVYTSLQTGMIDTINSVPEGLRAYSWWELLKYVQLPYQSYSDAYIMANGTWFNGLPKDLQDLILEVGREVGEIATKSVMENAEIILDEFKQRGGVVTVLDGAAKAEFDTLMQERVIPQVEDLIAPGVLEAAQAFVAQ